jgi:electron transfer flavoprotein beta subunit
MDIVACIKETFDTQAKIVLDDNGNIDENDVKYVLNPFDEYAVEEAVSLKERFGGTVTVVTASARDPKGTVFYCLAMGADNAVIISDPAMKQCDAHVTALVLSRVLSTMRFDLIVCGREAIDDGASEVPSRLAALLDLPQVTVVSSLVVSDGTIKAKRDIDGGTELVSGSIPCLLSVQKGLNIPRYPSLRAIMMAKKKVVNHLRFSDLSIDPKELQPFVRVQKINLSELRKGGEIFTGAVKESVVKLVEIIQKRTSLCQ